MRHTFSGALMALMALTALLGACATDPAQQAGPQVKVVCEKEAPTGSRLPRERCWTSEEAAQNERDVQNASRVYQRVRPSDVPTR
jgi:hypothetical protein